MPEDQFPVKKGTSTPTKEGQGINPDFSVMSAITPLNYKEKNTFSETVYSNTNTQNIFNSSKRKGKFDV